MLKDIEVVGVEESIRNWAAGKVGVPIIVRQCASQEESRLAVQSMPRLARRPDLKKVLIPESCSFDYKGFYRCLLYTSDAADE